MTLDRYTCLETVRRLDDYLDRELNVAERHEVERHLETCDRCLHRFRFEAGVVEEIKAKLRRVKQPEGLASRLKEVLRRGQTAEGDGVER